MTGFSRNRCELVDRLYRNEYNDHKRTRARFVDNANNVANVRRDSGDDDYDEEAGGFVRRFARNGKSGGSAILDDLPQWIHSICYPADQIGSEAVRMLKQLWNGEPARDVVLDCALLPGETMFGTSNA